MPFDPEPYIPFGRCSLLERSPRWVGAGNLFATAAVGNDAQRNRNIQHTVRYTEPAPDRFKDFWR
jgi:hypothetical protein